MPSRSLRIVNQSSYQSARAKAAVDAMTRAVRIQLRDVARVWGEYVWQVIDDANRRGFELVLLDDSDAAGALGYHDLDPDGRSYARVFVKTILNHNGTWLRGANSIAATVSHEACELVGDPTANHWVETATGTLVAVELCDPVEACAYPITLPDGRRVSVSDFVYPDWFNPYSAGKQLDHMNAVQTPFKSTAGGYVLQHTGKGVRTVWGPEHARWRRPGKRVPGSRTYVRHRLG